jgi:competence protein ComEC
VNPRRPALIAGVSYVAGISLGTCLDIPASFTVLGIVVLLLYLLPARTLRNHLLIVALVLAGILRVEWERTEGGPWNLRWDAEMVAEVVSMPERRGDDLIVLCRPDSVWAGPDCRVFSGFVRLIIRGDSPVCLGDRIRASGEMYRPPGRRNPGGHDYNANLARQGIAVTMRAHAEDVIVVEGGRPQWMVMSLLRVREWVRSTFQRSLSGHHLALLLGIVIGDRSGMDPEVRQLFSDVGIYHVLAQSGLHVGLMAGVILVVLHMLRIPHKPSSVILALLLIGYAAIVGYRPPVVRATAMAVTAMIAVAAERDVDFPNLLGFIALGILAIDPYALFDLGFLLSFAATASILVMMSFVVRLRSEQRSCMLTLLKRTVCLPAIVSLAAQLGTWPLLAYAFHRLSPLSVAANLIALPSVAAIIVLALCALAMAPINLELAHLFHAANWLVITVLLTVVRWIAHLPWTPLTVPQPPPILIGFYYLVLILGVLGRKHHGCRKAAIYLVLVAVNVVLWNGVRTQRGLEATFLDVGSGDCLFLRLPHGSTCLVDGGPRNPYWDSGKSVVMPFLRRYGVQRIDWVITTSLRADALGGLVTVLKEVPVGGVIHPGGERTIQTYQEFRQTIGEREIPEITVTTDECFEIDGVRFEAYPLMADRGIRSDGHMVVRISYGTAEYLLGSNISANVDRERLCSVDSSRLLGTGDRTSALRVLRPGLGGDRKATPLWLISAFSPTVVVFSVGSNLWSRPDQRLVQQCLDLEAQVWRTDQDGAICVWADGSRFRVETMRQRSRPSIRNGWRWLMGW